MTIRDRLRAWLGVHDEIPQKPPLKIAHHLFAEPAIDYTRKPLTFPKLPPGVGKPQMAMDDAFPFAGYLNTNTIAGAGAFGLYWPGYPYLAELAQRSEYRQPVETTAKEMTRKWIEFKTKGKGDKSKKIEQIQDAFEEFKIQEVFRKAATLDGFYGLGQLFIAIKGHDDHAEPLIIDKNTIAKGSLQGFIPIEPMWVTPLVWNSTDPTLPDFYKPEAWMVLGRKTHQSRLINFISREIPDIIKPAYNFGGISLTQLIEPYVQRWLKTVDSVNRLINTFSIIKFGTDMSAVLQGETNEDLLRRVKLFTQTRDNQGIFLHDKTEEMLEQLAVPLSGLSELQAQAQEHMAAPTHLPLVVLTGITPSGLNASSESEIEIFHDWVHSQQECLFTDPLQKILKIIQLHLFGTIDDDITFDYVPLKELTGEALANVRKSDADAEIAYINAGVLSVEEARERLATDADSPYTNLDVENIPEMPELETVEHQSGSIPEVEKKPNPNKED